MPLVKEMMMTITVGAISRISAPSAMRPTTSSNEAASQSIRRMGLVLLQVTAPRDSRPRAEKRLTTASTATRKMIEIAAAKGQFCKVSAC